MKEQNSLEEIRDSCKEIHILNLRTFRKAVTIFLSIWIQILIHLLTSLKCTSIHTAMELHHLLLKQNCIKKNRFLNFHSSLNLNKTLHSVNEQIFPKMDFLIQSVTLAQMQLRDICSLLLKTKRKKGLTVKTFHTIIKDLIY